MIRDTVNDYKKISGNVNKLIELSGRKAGYVQKEMGMDTTGFYRKLKEKSFTENEVEAIIKILFPEGFYKKELVDAVEKGRADIATENVISPAEMRKEMREKIASYQ